MKLIFFEIEEWQKEPFKQAFPEDEVIFVTETLTEDNAEQFHDADYISTFIQSHVTREVIDLYPQLKFITTRSTGFDHIDHAYAKTKGIYVANVPNYGENTVAEHTFALILALSRKIFQSYERTEKMNFKIDKSLQGFDLKGKTIGIYGLGNIGEYVAKMAQGFSMNILAYKRTPDPQLAQKYGIEFVSSVQDILSRSDVITFHCHLSPETTHLVNKDNYRQIKKGAILVNTARGGIIDTEALLLALEEGYLSGAGLDVFEEESSLIDPIAFLNPHYREKHNIDDIVENHLLISRNDVILTPHNAFNSQEAVWRIVTTTIENIQRFMAGNSQNVVNPTW